MDVVIGALIGLAGGLLAALVVARQQGATTRALIAAEFDKLVRQHDLQAKAHARTRRDDWLLQTIPPLLAASDPELHSEFNYTEVLSLVHKIQIILVPGRSLERAVNLATSELGFAVRAANDGQRDDHRILGAQDALVIATRALLDAP